MDIKHPMKIIQVIYSLSSGGAEKFVIDLSNQLARMGHEVIVCMLRKTNTPDALFNKQYLEDKIKFHSMGFDRGFSLSKCNRLERFIKSQAPDIVHCHLNVIPFLFKLALLNQLPAILHTLHSIASKTVGKGPQYYLNRYFYKQEKIIPVSISKLCQLSYETFYGLQNSPLINNGRSEMRTSEYYQEVQREVAVYRTTDKTKVFIHIARFHPAKNQQLLIDSFNQLNASGEDFVLLVIGRGFDSYDGRKLEEQACDKIIFLGEKNNVNDYLHCADAFCLTSYFEGLPLSLLEALSCGVTPICTAVGGIPDVLLDGVNGYLSPSLEINDYIQTINRYLQKPIAPKKLIEFYRKNFSMEECAKKYEILYKETLSKRIR